MLGGLQTGRQGDAGGLEGCGRGNAGFGAQLPALAVLTRLQQWNPERYGNGTIEDWKITVFSEPFEEFSKT